MKLYLVSLAVGVLVGVIYGLLGVRSPAPPVVALIGLAGMLIGEQLIALAKQPAADSPSSISAPSPAPSKSSISSSDKT